MGHASESVVDRERRAARPAPASTLDQNAAPPAQNAADTEQAPRSSYGTVPGAEFPAFVYVSVLIAFAWIMLASWLAFAGDADASLALGIAIVLAIVFFALPVIIRQVAVAHFRHKRDTTHDFLPSRVETHDFLSSRVETATGTLPGSSAWLQVLLIPLALALAATLIGTTYLLVR